MYYSRITGVHPNVKFLFSRVTVFRPTILVLTRFLREKRLSNAQGRELCEANAGHAPRAMVIWGRGIVGDEEEEMTVGGDDRFWSVSHIRRRYTKPVFTGFPLQLYGKQLLQICIYMLNRPCEAARQIEDGVLYLWKMPNKIFCKFTFFHADTKTDHKSQIQW